MARTEPAPNTLRRAAERRGRRAETLAAWFLRAKGYRILARRFKTPVGEIDIIARRGGTIAFVEVKSRAGEGDAIEAILPGRGRIIRAAEAWLARHPDAAPFALRFDAILAGGRRLPRHLKGLFDADGID